MIKLGTMTVFIDAQIHQTYYDLLLISYLQES